MLNQVMGDAAQQTLVVALPSDVAEVTGEAAAYLCSAAAGYVTGVVLDVDGGLGIGSSIR